MYGCQWNKLDHLFLGVNIDIQRKFGTAWRIVKNSGKKQFTNIIMFDIMMLEQNQ